MINFEQIEIAGDDFWSDYESEIVMEKMAHFSAADWRALGSELAIRGAVCRERIAQLLGNFDVTEAANILLPLAASKDREIALTARESLRGMSFQVVTASARSLASQAKLVMRAIDCRSTNEILDAIEYRPGAA
jgi:hypothetical protein